MDSLTRAWISLGIAFAGVPKGAADPERTLIDSILLVPRERKLVGLIIAWIKYYGDLIHLQRVNALAKDLSPLSMCWLGGIAAHAATHDKRWRIVENAARESHASSGIRPKTAKLDRLVAKRKGHDKLFKKFGLTIPQVDSARQEKLLRRAPVLRQHPWLRLRALFGANWRADIAWLMLKNPNQTPYQVAKKLGCNMETAYRNWKALKEADATKLLNIQA